jgi:hypothetical protein
LALIDTQDFQNVFDHMERVGLKPDVGQVISFAVGLVEDGTINVRKTAPRTAEQIAGAAQVRVTAYHWLRGHPAPNYDGNRANARSLPEIVAEMGLPYNPSTRSIVRGLIESETTGWGKVDLIQGQPLYAAKALLLSFRKAA